jgi:hypothetical protein
VNARMDARTRAKPIMGGLIREISLARYCYRSLSSCDLLIDPRLASLRLHEGIPVRSTDSAISRAAQLLRLYFRGGEMMMWRSSTSRQQKIARMG